MGCHNAERARPKNDDLQWKTQIGDPNDGGDPNVVLAVATSVSIATLSLATRRIHDLVGPAYGSSPPRTTACCAPVVMTSFVCGAALEATAVATTSSTRRVCLRCDATGTAAPSMPPPLPPRLSVVGAGLRRVASSASAIALAAAARARTGWRGDGGVHGRGRGQRQSMSGRRALDGAGPVGEDGSRVGGDVYVGHEWEETYM